ncbi:MAG: MerR family transcriptional regulator [Actinobacteria bacterium]|nr:MAG: MerR family transcriptional regulator [Actinomycetota bacterium]TMK62596.1 MAG: MerR family transcriptional regulator [Actinomycetota bacterium]
MAARDNRSDRGQDRAVYIISVAAELAGVHPQTLRIYERKGLLSPKRTSGNTRRYSERDIARLQVIQQLTQGLGINLAGVKMIMELETQLEELRRRAVELESELRRVRRGRPVALGPSSAAMEIVPLRTISAFPWLSGGTSR